MADSGCRAFHDGCGGMVVFGIAGDGFCIECEDENVTFDDYTLVAVKPPVPEEPLGLPLAAWPPSVPSRPRRMVEVQPVLCAHTLLIAAIFVPYFILMVILGVYIYRTGRPRSDDPPDAGEDDRDPGPAIVPLAA